MEYAKASEVIDELQRRVNAEFRRMAEAQEKRRLEYQAIAARWLGSCKVAFCEVDPGTAGNYRPGIIRLSPDLALNKERSTAMHEIGHGMTMKQATDIPDGPGVSKVDVLLSPEFSAHVGIDVRSIALKAYRAVRSDEEAMADEVGRKLFEHYWPGGEYEPGDSTEFQMESLTKRKVG